MQMDLVREFLDEIKFVKIRRLESVLKESLPNYEENEIITAFFTDYFNKNTNRSKFRKIIGFIANNIFDIWENPVLTHLIVFIMGIIFGVMFVYGRVV